MTIEELGIPSLYRDSSNVIPPSPRGTYLGRVQEPYAQPITERELNEGILVRRMVWIRAAAEAFGEKEEKKRASGNQIKTPHTTS